MHPDQNQCAEAASEKTSAPEQYESDKIDPIRLRLYDQRRRLKRQLDQVQQAIDNLSDPSVQKVLQILDLAAR